MPEAHWTASMVEERFAEAADVMKRLKAATNDLRAAEEMVREAKRKLADLQREKVTASFAYDAARAELLRAGDPKAA